MRFRVRAARHGRPMEHEAKEMLEYYMIDDDDEQLDGEVRFLPDGHLMAPYCDDECVEG